MSWILLVGAAWPAAAVVTALVLGRVISRADQQAAVDTTPNFVVEGPVAQGWPRMFVPPAGSAA
jgi:hypothetical protein